MTDYTAEELIQALRAVTSMIHKCEKAQEKFPEGNSQYTLLRNRLKAMYISKELITERLSDMETDQKPRQPELKEWSGDELLSRLELLRTTELGALRIRKNLCLSTGDVVGWCREQIKSPGAVITRRGKNWYVAVNGCRITINAKSFTIITAHSNS